ncbi:hypothetical protein B484DRAFT_450138 [Ochromonadaceae sp. CCMP2298]|nr:hypothetical protein B484DRAFT_450138 [Ochromonadaceae sp. CCMP2298]
MIALLAFIIVLHIVNMLLHKHIYEQTEDPRTLVPYSHPGEYAYSLFSSTGGGGAPPPKTTCIAPKFVAGREKGSRIKSKFDRLKTTEKQKTVGGGGSWCGGWWWWVWWAVVVVLVVVGVV